MNKNERPLGRCDTEDCYRQAVVTHVYADPENMSGEVEADLCLPCRRVLEHARGVPWNDERDNWRDGHALEIFMKGGDVDRRYTDTDTDA